jgi:hypothetical protein
LSAVYGDIQPVLLPLVPGDPLAIGQLDNVVNKNGEPGRGSIRTLAVQARHIPLTATWKSSSLRCSFRHDQHHLHERDPVPDNKVRVEVESSRLCPA